MKSESRKEEVLDDETIKRQSRRGNWGSTRIR